MYSEDELLDLSGLQHLAYCERQWALIHLECLWDESVDTVRGDAFHERAHLDGYSTTKGVVAIRSMPLVNYALGIKGQADIVEFEADENGKEGWCIDFGALGLTGGEKEVLISCVRPVEYKVGKPKVKNWDRIQVCAQGMCLEEAFGVSVSEGSLFYGETRHRERVMFDEGLRQETAQLAVRMHTLFESRMVPSAVFGSRCKKCSLAAGCMPEALGRDASAYWKLEGFAVRGNVGDGEIGESK